MVEEPVALPPATRLVEEPVAVADISRADDVRRRLVAAEAAQEGLALSLGLERERNKLLSQQLQAKPTVGKTGDPGNKDLRQRKAKDHASDMLAAVRRRFDEAEALQQSLRQSLTDELARTRVLQSQLKERASPSVSSPTRLAAENRRLNDDLAEMKSQRDAARAQCRQHADELQDLSATAEVLRQQVLVRDEERRELVQCLGFCLSAPESDLSMDSLKRRLQALIATRDAALQNAQQERANFELFKVELEAMRQQRDEAQGRLKAEEQKLQCRVDDLIAAEARIGGAAKRSTDRQDRRLCDLEDELSAANRREQCANVALAACEKKLAEDMMLEVKERALLNALRQEMQVLQTTVETLQYDLSGTTAQDTVLPDGRLDLERLHRELRQMKQDLSSLRSRAQTKDTLLEQASAELEETVQRLTQVSNEKAKLQFEVADQGKALAQARQRLQTAEAQLLEAVQENRQEAESAFLLAEVRKQLAAAESTKLSLAEGLELEKAETERLRAEVARLLSDRDVACSRENALVESEMALQCSRAKLQQENAELAAGLEDERNARRRLEMEGFLASQSRLEEELAHERRWRNSLEEELEVQQRLRQQAEQALLEVEKRLESVEVEQRKLCAVESARAQGWTEVTQLREEIAELSAALETERAHVRQLEAAQGMGDHRLQEALAREQSDLAAIRNLLAKAMKERDDALEKALLMQDVSRSVEELHEQLAKAMTDREKLSSQLGQQQRDFATLQSTLDLVKELRSTARSTARSRTPTGSPPRRTTDSPPRTNIVEEPVVSPILGGIVSSPMRASRKLAMMGEASRPIPTATWMPKEETLQGSALQQAAAVRQERQWESPNRRAVASPEGSPSASVSTAYGTPLRTRGKDPPPK